MYETTRPYESYPGQRLADFNEYERTGMQGVYDTATGGDPAEIGMASKFAQNAGNYVPGTVSSAKDKVGIPQELLIPAIRPEALGWDTALPTTNQV